MITDRVPLVDLRAQMAELSGGLEDDVLKVLASAYFIGGPEVAAFEEEYAAYVGVEHCIGVANGTDAVEMALRAVGVSSGDEVILPANTFIATAEAVVRAGAQPVLIDVLPETLLLDPSQVEAAMTARTRAVVPVHLFGQVASMKHLLAVSADRGIPVIEDAAQSQGARVAGRAAGAIGAAGATSFYPGKNLGAAGDAGAVTTNDPEIARSVRLLANHGSPSKYVHEVVGFNSRLDAIQAVVLRHKLRRLEEWNDKRRAHARRYSELLAEFPGITLPTCLSSAAHVWHLYVIQVAQRDEVLRHLGEQGIDAGVHYPVPVHLTTAFRYLGHKPGDFPVTEEAAGRILSLPMYPHLTVAQQDRVVAALAAAPALSA